MSLFKQIAEATEISKVVTPEPAKTLAAGAKPAIDLSLMNDVNQEVTKQDVDDLIKGAHDAEEEIETVTFGFETADGEIVKVYVNVEDADGFEDAASKMLGSEDSIEDALQKLAEDFDIVDVEWPEDEEDDEENEPEPEEEALDKSEEEDVEDIETAMPTSESSLGKRFLNRVLAEEKTEKKQDKDSEELYAIDPDIKDAETYFKFANKFHLKVFRTVLLLDFPLVVLTRSKHDVRDGVVAAAEHIRGSSATRLLFDRFYIELNKFLNASKEHDKSKEEVSEGNEKQDARFSNIIQKKIYDLYVLLGVSEEMMKPYFSARVRPTIVRMSKKIASSTRLKALLFLLVEHLDEDNVKTDATIEVKEEMGAIMEALSVNSEDDYATAAAKLMELLGLDDEHVKNPELLGRRLIERKHELGNISAVIRNLGKMAAILEKSQAIAGNTPAPAPAEGEAPPAEGQGAAGTPPAPGAKPAPAAPAKPGVPPKKPEASGALPNV